MGLTVIIDPIQDRQFMVSHVLLLLLFPHCHYIPQYSDGFSTDVTGLIHSNDLQGLQIDSH